MQKITYALVLLMASSSLETAYAAKATVVERSVNWPQFISILQRLKDQNRNKQGGERVTCSGPDGTTVEFTTTGLDGRELTSAVKVKVENRTMILPASQFSNFYNGDDRMAMDVFKKGADEPYYSFRAELAPTVSPQMDEVATHSGTVTVVAAGYLPVQHQVSCSTFKKRAGLSMPQVYAGNLGVKCFLGKTAGTAQILSFEVANTASRRLVSDLQEVRSASDSEVLPSFLISQFRFTKAQLDVELDDGSADGNVIARLSAAGERVPTGQVDAQNSAFGIWSGTYERFDTGRQFRSPVTCYGKEIV